MQRAQQENYKSGTNYEHKSINAEKFYRPIYDNGAIFVIIDT